MERCGDECCIAVVSFEAPHGKYRPQSIGQEITDRDGIGVREDKGTA